MTKSQAYELIGVAWLAVAAFDEPHDFGTIIYVGLAVSAFYRACRADGCAR